MVTVGKSSEVVYAMQTAHQSRIIARASRCLVGCTDLESFFSLVRVTFGELNCSGYARIHYGEDTNYIKLGTGFTGSENEQPGADDTHCIVGGHFTYSAEHVVVVLDITQESEQQCLRDSVESFLDSMNTWVKQYLLLRTERTVNHSEKQNVVNNLKNFTLCLHRINDHLLKTQNCVREDLLGELAAAFQVMGLDMAQEEVMLKIVNKAIDRENHLLRSQVQQNIELRQLIEGAVNAIDVDASQSVMPRQ